MIVSLAMTGVLVGAAALLSRKTPGTERSELHSVGVESSFLDNFTLDRYKPMLRLASRMDSQYLERQHSPELARVYRNLQRQMLRDYLTELSNDFRQLYSIAIAKAVRATSDPLEHSSALFDQQISFIFAIWSIEARLQLDRFCPVAMNLEPIISQIAELVDQARELSRPQFAYTSLR